MKRVIIVDIPKKGVKMNVQEIDEFSLISCDKRDLIIGDDKMEKFNGMPVYWLGVSIGKLEDTYGPSLNIANIAGPGINVRSNLEWFKNTVQGFPLSKITAENIIRTLNFILSPTKLATPQTVVTQEEQSRLNVDIYDFQAVMLNEFSQTNIFYVTQLRAYDMATLINEGQNVLSRDTLNSLGDSKIDVIRDIREATRSLAFDISTAVGFHVYRAIEAIIIKDYFSVLNVPGKEWHGNKNLGNYIKILEKYNVNVKVTAILRHLKDHYRNPILHPEEFWDSDKAESALMLAVGVITIMVQDIQEIKKMGIALPPP